MNKWFMYDHGGDGFCVFDTETEALAAADVAIKEYRDASQTDGEWHDEVERVYVGRLTHRVELQADEDEGFEAVLRDLR